MSFATLFFLSVGATVLSLGATFGYAAYRRYERDARLQERITKLEAREAEQEEEEDEDCRLRVGMRVDAYLNHDTYARGVVTAFGSRFTNKGTIRHMVFVDVGTGVIPFSPRDIIPTDDETDEPTATYRSPAKNKDLN